MDPQKRKLLLLAGIGIAILYLFSRAKKSSPTSQAAVSDPLQGVAQQLTAQRAQQQASLEYAQAQVAANEVSTQTQFDFFKHLAADPAYACPNGGRPRWIPGQGPGCIEKRTGAITLGSILSGVLSGYQASQTGGGFRF